MEKPFIRALEAVHSAIKEGKSSEEMEVIISQKFSGKKYGLKFDCDHIVKSLCVDFYSIEGACWSLDMHRDGGVGFTRVDLGD